jgi:RimJ/RimL family protein N-acetyltransferase
MTQFPLGELLPAGTLALRETLPAKPPAVALGGRFVRLEPLDIERDAAALHRVSDGQALTLGDRHIDAYDTEKLIWRYLPYGPFESLNDFARYLVDLSATDRLRAFTVVDVASGHPVGVVTYSANFPEHLKIEIAHVWYSPLVQRTNANLESTYLLLKNAFELGYRRVEWKCDALNERSRRSALRMGFRFEGIQEAHYITKGRNRDTAWFRMLASEWPDARARLEKMLDE